MIGAEDKASDEPYIHVLPGSTCRRIAVYKGRWRVLEERRSWPATTCLDVVLSQNVQKSTISTFEDDFFSANPKRTTPSSLPFSGGFNGVD